MVIENGIIVKCTEAELYAYYLERDWDDIYSFPEYKEMCIRFGTEVTDV